MRKTDWRKLPERYKGALQRYIEYGTHPGGFLLSVLENNLLNAFGYADDKSREDLYTIVMFIYNELPINCWGSTEKVNLWIARRENERIR